MIKQETQDSGQAQPPLPLTIVGSGFGYLSGLPWATQEPQYIDIQAYSATGKLLWDTAAGNCQIYINDWTDTSISLLLGLPVGIQNGAGTALSPLTDMNPSTFFQAAPASRCPVAAGDLISVTVTSPQSGNNKQLANSTSVLIITTTPY